jgi:hypothetical protein
MCIGFRFAATWPTFPTFNGSRLKCPCKKDQSSPGEFTGVPALATRRRHSVCSGEHEGPWPEPQRSAEGSSQMRVNATPGCDANP